MSDNIQEQIEQLNQQINQLYQQAQYKEAIYFVTQVCDLTLQHVGKVHPDFATSLDSLAKLYLATGNYAEAEPRFQEALAIRRAALGETHPDVATSLNNLARLHQMTGNYAEAEPRFQEALAIRRTALGEAHPDFAASLDSLARLHQMTGNYAEAKPLLEQALAIRRTALGETHPDFATSLNNLAVLYHTLGNYAEAEPRFQQALAIRRTALGESHPAAATSLNDLGWLYSDMGNYVEAESLFQQALVIQRSTLGETNLAVAASLSNLAALYYAAGNYAEAEPLFKQALAIRRAALEESHPDVATSLNNLGQLYLAIGSYTQARSLFEQALVILRTTRGEAHPDVAASLSNLAVLYRDIGDYAEAKPLLEQALAIRRTALGESHPDVATSLNSLAALYQDLGNYAEAEPRFQQALAIRRTALGESHPAVSTSLDYLGQLYLATGSYTQAVSSFQQALAIRRTALGEAHPDFATSLNNLAALYHTLGNYAEAEPRFQQALAILRTALGESHPDVTTTLNNLGLLYAATARKNEALTLMEQSAIIGDQVIGQVFSSGSERQRMMYLTSLQWHFDIFLSLVLQSLSSFPVALQAGLDLVLRRKALGAEALVMQRDAILGGRYPHLVPKLRELTMLGAQITQKTLAGPGIEGFEVHQRFLAKWNAQKDQLEADLARQIPEMTLAPRLQIANRQAVAAALPRGTALVEFVRFGVFDFRAIPARGEKQWKPAHYVAFVLMADEPESVEMIDLGEADPIDQLIATFVTSLTTEAGHLRHMTVKRPLSKQASYTSTGRALRAVLFDRLLRVLRGCKRLFLSPDGDLTRLPFEVLPIDDEHYVIDDYQISYLSTGRDVLRFNVSSTATGSPLVVADPDFDLSDEGHIPASEATVVSAQRWSHDLNRDTLRFDPLPGTQREGQQVATLLEVEPLLGKAALESTLKAVRSPLVLHIATHGFFLPDQQQTFDRERDAAPMLGGSTKGRLERFFGRQGENPLLRSGLVLAGVNTWNRGASLPAEAEDGLLMAEDVSGLDLLGTELVVLSACETGLGKVHVGEGVFGLRRAFVLAGARTLVMSLWKVPDAHTQELMGTFYRFLLEGLPRADALRTAQLAMKEQYTHPFYWGAFICQGYPGPLPQ